MIQDEALTILKTGANVFLTGEPGSGKSHTVNTYVSYLKERGIEPAITASTGIAATHIHGMTIHSWSGIGISNTLSAVELDRIASREPIVKRIRYAHVLIIDEISMLSASTLDMVEAVCREIRQNDEPFGGLQIVFVGDFFQLPPVVRNKGNESSDVFYSDEPQSIFSFSSGAWKRAKPVVCYLSEQHRQEDDTFLSILSAIRTNELRDDHVDYLDRRKVSSIPKDVTKLYSHNADVDRINAEELAKLPGDLKQYRMLSRGRESLVDTLKRGCLSPQILELKEGASVMFTKNSIPGGFVNGTLGIVTGFSEGSKYPIVRTTNGKYIETEPLDWNIEDNGRPIATITQIPLRLAWAITVHKSQGMSMDAAVMDLSGAFEYGQGYVALSRVRSLKGLHLLGINERALQVHPEILEKDIAFRESSEVAQETFANLSKKEIKTMHQNFIHASGGHDPVVVEKKQKSRKKNKV